MTGAVIYGGRISSDFNRPTEAICNEWHKTETFADHRIGPQPKTITIPKCEEAKAKAQYKEHRLKNILGTWTRIVEINDELAPSAPIWLHVHGITSNWLHGLRYQEAAARLGFRLMMVELLNHGKSQRVGGGTSWGCKEKYDIISALQQILHLYPEAKILVTATSMGTLAVTEAALMEGTSWQSVKGVVFESPIPDLHTLYTLLAKRFPLPMSMFPSYDGLLSLASLRSDTDFKRCFQMTKKSKTPLLIMLSEFEYPEPSLRELVISKTRFEQITTVQFPRGNHSAYWNYQPEEFEKEIGDFYRRL